ncbi:hypothetical protein ACGYWN_11090, partial [Burkholderia pseudomallei]
NPDPRKTKPHAHKNVGFVSSLKPLFYKGFFLFPTVFFPRGAYARALASPRGAVSRHPSAAPRHSVPLRVIGSCHARAQHSG